MCGIFGAVSSKDIQKDLIKRENKRETGTQTILMQNLIQVYCKIIA